MFKNIGSHHPFFWFVVILPAIGCARPHLRSFKPVDASTNAGPILAPPTQLLVAIPSAAPFDISTPTISVLGVASGQEVKLYSDAACTVEIGSETATGSTVDILVVSALSAGVHQFYAKITGPTESSSCSTASVSYNLQFNGPSLDAAFYFTAPDVYGGGGGPIVNAIANSATPTLQLRFQDRAAISSGSGIQTDFSVDAITSDGRYAVIRKPKFFTGYVDGMVGGSVTPQLYRRDLVTGEYAPISTKQDGTFSDKESYDTALSADGSVAVFKSAATNLDSSIQYAAEGQVYEKNLSTGVITTVSQSGGAYGRFSIAGGTFGRLLLEPTGTASERLKTVQITGDGAKTFFTTEWATYVGASNASLVERTSSGPTISANLSTLSATVPRVLYYAVTPDGRYIAFVSETGNIVAGYASTRERVYRLDTQTATIEIVSTDSVGTELALPEHEKYGGLSMSDNGRYISFIALGSSNNNRYLRKDLTTGTLAIISTDSSGTEVTASGHFRGITTAMSSDGNLVFFSTTKTGLVPGADGSVQVYRKNMTTGEVHLLSSDGIPPLVDARKNAFLLGVTGDGRYVFWNTRSRYSTANDQTPDLVESFHGYRFDTATNALEQISVPLDRVTAGDEIHLFKAAGCRAIDQIGSATYTSGQTLSISVDAGTPLTLLSTTTFYIQPRNPTNGYGVCQSTGLSYTYN